MDENDDAIPIDELPSFIAREIVEKLHPFDYMRFERCSNLANWYSHQIRNRIPVEVGAIHMSPKGLKASSGGACQICVFQWKEISGFPYRLNSNQLRLEFPLSKELCTEMAEELIKNQTTTQQFMINVDLEEIWDQVAKIANSVNPECVASYNFTPRQFVAALKPISCLHMKSCGINDEDLLRCHFRSLVFTTGLISLSGVNRYIKQWLQGERETTELHIQFEHISPSTNSEGFLEDLEPNLVWSAASHSDSEVGSIQLETIFDIRRNDAPLIFSVFKSTDVSDFRMILLANTSIRLVRAESEKEFLVKTLLNEAQRLEISQQ